jgi:hypothetical protein
MQDLTVAGAINGADTSAASAGEALTSDGSGSFTFSSVGGIKTVVAFNNLPTPNPPQISFVQDEENYYAAKNRVGETSFFSSIFTQLQSVANLGSGETSIIFSTDGNNVFETEGNNGSVRQFPVNVPFSISSIGNQTASHSTPDDNLRDVAFSPDGTKMFTTQNRGSTREFTLSSPFDLSGNVTLENTIGFSESNGLDIANNGEYLYGTGRNNNIRQGELTTPFDLSTITNIQTQPHGLGEGDGVAMSPTGSFISVVRTNNIFEGELNTPFDISSGFSTTNTKTIGGGNNSCVQYIKLGNEGTVTTFNSGISKFKLAEGGWKQIA